MPRRDLHCNKNSLNFSRNYFYTFLLFSTFAAALRHLR